MPATQTRSQRAITNERLNRQGLDVSNILPGKRRTQQPNRFGAAPSTYRDRHGKTHFNPGSSEVVSVRMKLSGNSMSDIHKLRRTTGLGLRGSGMTWHHMSDLNPETGIGTVTLVPSNIHGHLRHMGGSAQKRSLDDPDKNYGMVQPLNKRRF